MVQKGKLPKKALLACDTMAFPFEKPEGFTFRAGQYGDWMLDTDRPIRD